MMKDATPVTYTAVKTTGIYCVPTCSAKPKKENTLKYSDALLAERDGFRPCKRCHPTAYGLPWHDHQDYITIGTPQDFSFSQCLAYLGRSDLECMHRVEGQSFYKLLPIDHLAVPVEITMPEGELVVRFLSGKPPKWARARIARLVWDMFDLGVDIEAFYRFAAQDPLLSTLTKKFRGLRTIKMQNSFEALVWAIIGQQINLTFAFTLKQRLLNNFGEKQTHEGRPFYLFPKPGILANLDTTALTALQFTGRKAEYIIGIAKLFAEGELRHAELATLDYESLKEKLLAIRGVGHWTADYVIMKCFNHYQAFPIQDVGLHNAFKTVLGRDKKPELSEMAELAAPWAHWASYAASYLWRVLYD